jgi:hypothetical protein
MATLTNKTDEIAALETLRKDLAKYEKSLIEKKDSPEKVKQSIKIKIADIRKQIREGKTTDKEVTAKQLADSLLRSRKKFLEMSKKDFNGVIRQLAKKPEYAFLKGMSRDEVVRDIQRKAKPVGWRFKGRENYKTPTPQQVRRGRANGTVYYENRPNRSDVSQTKQLAKGGFIAYADWDYDNKLGTFSSMQKMKDFAMKNKGKYDEIIFEDEYGDNIVVTKDDTAKDLDFLFSEMAKGGSMKGEILPYCIYVTNLNNPNINSELVAKVKREGDARLILSELNKSLHKDTPLVYTMSKKKYDDGGSIPMSMSQLRAMREEDFDFDMGEDSYEDDGVTRQYFEDEAYSYENGGEIDINDLNIPVHYTMFEDEMYDYARGGRVSKVDKKYPRYINEITEVVEDENGRKWIYVMQYDKEDGYSAGQWLNELEDYGLSPQKTFFLQKYLGKEAVMAVYVPLELKNKLIKVRKHLGLKTLKK